MSRKITLLLILALVLNLVLAGIIIYNRNGTLSTDSLSIAYLFGRGIIYWLRPFLFVAMTRFYYIITKRKFSENVAIGAYGGSWLILLIGMFYNYY